MKLKKIISIFIIMVLLIHLFSNIVLAYNSTVENTITENNTDLIENSIVENKNITDTNITTNDNSITTPIDDNNKLTPQMKELLSLSNIDDVNELSSRITNEQMDTLITQIKPNTRSIDTNITLDNFGIWITEDSRELITTFINNHSSYSYSINSNGYLLCDNTLRENKNLDLIEPSETEMDIGLSDALNRNQTIIIKISDFYYNFNDTNTMNSISFDNTTYSKAYEYENLRIIFLNSQFYNFDNIDFNLPLSDDFIKALNNIQYKVLIGEIQFSQDQSISTRFTDNGQTIRDRNRWSNSLFWT